MPVSASHPIFAPWLALWNLTPDGAPIVSHAAHLLPVRWQGKAAMLKVSTEQDEKLGFVLMEWWDGVGSAQIFANGDEAILLERAEGTRSLVDYARDGRDDEATRILCDVAAILHAPRAKPLPELIPLSVWFRELGPAAAIHGGILARADGTARFLLSDPQDVSVLHGDIHHGNILDFGARGWLAIDPKRLHGERGFDYANIFTNPDMDDPSRPVATIRENFMRRLEIVTEKSGIDRRRLLQWILAWTGLSAAWILGDGDDPAVDLRVAELAIAELDR